MTEGREQMGIVLAGVPGVRQRRDDRLVNDGWPTAPAMRDALSANMTPAELAEAERLVREWKPDPASCEAMAGG